MRGRERTLCSFQNPLAGVAGLGCSLPLPPPPGRSVNYPHPGTPPETARGWCGWPATWVSSADSQGKPASPQTAHLDTVGCPYWSVAGGSCPNPGSPCHPGTCLVAGWQEAHGLCVQSGEAGPCTAPELPVTQLLGTKWPSSRCMEARLLRNPVSARAACRETNLEILS